MKELEEVNVDGLESVVISMSNFNSNVCIDVLMYFDSEVPFKQFLHNLEKVVDKKFPDFHPFSYLDDVFDFCDTDEEYYTNMRESYGNGDMYPLPYGYDGVRFSVEFNNLENHLKHPKLVGYSRKEDVVKVPTVTFEGMKLTHHFYPLKEKELKSTVVDVLHSRFITDIDADLPKATEPLEEFQVSKFFKYSRPTIDKVSELLEEHFKPNNEGQYTTFLNEETIKVKIKVLDEVREYELTFKYE